MIWLLLKLKMHSFLNFDEIVDCFHALVANTDQFWCCFFDVDVFSESKVVELPHQIVDDWLFIDFSVNVSDHVIMNR